jgi:hypothetical protein
VTSTGSGGSFPAGRTDAAAETATVERAEVGGDNGYYDKELPAVRGGNPGSRDQVQALPVRSERSSAPPSSVGAGAGVVEAAGEAVAVGAEAGVGVAEAHAAATIAGAASGAATGPGPREAVVWSVPPLRRCQCRCGCEPDSSMVSRMSGLGWWECPGRGRGAGGLNIPRDKQAATSSILVRDMPGAIMEILNTKLPDPGRIPVWWFFLFLVCQVQ